MALLSGGRGMTNKVTSWKKTLVEMKMKVNVEAFRKAAVLIGTAPDRYRFKVVYAPTRDWPVETFQRGCMFGWVMAFGGLGGKVISSSYARGKLGVSYSEFMAWCVANHHELMNRSTANVMAAVELLEKFADAHDGVDFGSVVCGVDNSVIGG